MLVKESVWQKIRSQFSELEKIELRSSITGESICPRGWLVSEEEMSKRLFRKLSKLIEEVSL